MINVDEWIKKGTFLPRFLRDFHDQKDFFKCLFGLWVIPHREKLDAQKEFDYIKELNFVQAQIFVIDYFLRFLARHGYTIQKVRSKGEFCDIYNTIQKYDEEQKEAFFQALKNRRYDE
jgi:hypothetical protein